MGSCPLPKRSLPTGAPGGATGKAAMGKAATGMVAPQPLCLPAHGGRMPGHGSSGSSEPAASPLPQAGGAGASSLLDGRQGAMAAMHGPGSQDWALEAGPCLRPASGSCPDRGPSERCPAQVPEPGWRVRLVSTCCLDFPRDQRGAWVHPGSGCRTGLDRARQRRHRTGTQGPSTCRETGTGAGGHMGGPG